MHAHTKCLLCALALNYKQYQCTTLPGGKKTQCFKCEGLARKTDYTKEEKIKTRGKGGGKQITGQGKKILVINRQQW